MKAELRRRGDEAKAKAENATPRDASTDLLWTAADLFDAGEDLDADDDE
jgi:hypothetical protein